MREAFSPLPYLHPPALDDGVNNSPRMLMIALHSAGDKARDTRRLRHIHGLLKSSPGQDRFSFMLYEGEQSYLIEFPNDTTGITDDLLRKLNQLVGPMNVHIEPIGLDL